MKSLSKLTAAVALAIAVSAPAFAGYGANDAHNTAGMQAQAYAPATQNGQDPAAYAGQY